MRRSILSIVLCFVLCSALIAAHGEGAVDQVAAVARTEIWRAISNGASSATVAILDGRPLPVVEVRPKTGVYDYQTKYTSGSTDYLCPAPFAPELTARIQDAGLGAFRAIGGRDYSRVDVMVDAAGAVYVLEVNTLPGMTETSLLPKAAAAAGISYTTLCHQMVQLAWRRAPRNR